MPTFPSAHESLAPTLEPICQFLPVVPTDRRRPTCLRVAMPDNSILVSIRLQSARPALSDSPACPDGHSDTGTRGRRDACTQSLIRMLRSTPLTVVISTVDRSQGGQRPPKANTWSLLVEMPEQPRFSSNVFPRRRRAEITTASTAPPSRPRWSYTSALQPPSSPPLRSPTYHRRQGHNGKTDQRRPTAHSHLPSAFPP